MISSLHKWLNICDVTRISRCGAMWHEANMCTSKRERDHVLQSSCNILEHGFSNLTSAENIFRPLHWNIGYGATSCYPKRYHPPGPYTYWTIYILVWIFYKRVYCMQARTPRHISTLVNSVFRVHWSSDNVWYWTLLLVRISNTFVSSLLRILSQDSWIKTLLLAEIELHYSALSFPVATYGG